MSLIFWKSAEPPDAPDTTRGTSEVNEQHPLPIGLYWTRAQGTDQEQTGPAHPLPTQIIGTATTRPPLVIVPPTMIPGVGAAAAYAQDEQMGKALIVSGVPRKGVIQELRFHDRDDEGLNKEVWIFSSQPTLAADNAAFSLADADLDAVVAVFVVSTWRDAVNGQLGLTQNTPAAYGMPYGNSFWIAVKTLGADNIAAGSEPKISMVIEERS